MRAQLEAVGKYSKAQIDDAMAKTAATYAKIGFEESENKVCHGPSHPRMAVAECLRDVDDVLTQIRTPMPKRLKSVSVISSARRMQTFGISA